MKIKTKDGEIIDLAELRERMSWRRPETTVGETLGLLDALEAALSVSKAASNAAEYDYANGYNAGLADVRQAAGVIE